ncbi:MAG TPA: recombinase family protein [Candidatus Paenibacillus intestinavium]|nr:recombinase family protein [Candidatus Paenibacillus intestinavium]
MELDNKPGCLYLRKSRKDVQAEKEALALGKPYDTLARHMDMLIEMVTRYKVNVIDTFTEVVSGEFIAERDEFQKVLLGLSEGKYEWVGVVDEDRLGRGDKIDQGRIERAFKVSGALILTPYKIVDMDNEADEQYMDYKGMGARYEYKQTKKRLQSGRKSSASEGNYLGRITPFGYLKGIELKTEFPELIKHYADRAADIRNLRLYPHPDNADIVKQIFKLVSEKTGIRTIARMFTGLYPNPSGKLTWERSTIINIVRNRVYVGEIIWGSRKFTKQENGTYLVKPVAEAEQTIVPNAHIALVSEAEYQLANKTMSEGAAAPINRGKIMTNVFAGLLKCYFCEQAMSYAPYYSQPNKKPRLMCTNIYCKRSASIIFELIESDVLSQIKLYYEHLSSEPIKQNKKKSASEEMKNRRLDKLERDLAEVEEQLNEQFDLLERKAYTIDIFMQRQETTLARKESMLNEISQIQEELFINQANIRKQSQVAPLVKNVMLNYDTAESVIDKNDLLKSIIDKIYYKKEPSLKKSGTGEYTVEILWNN